ncbi:hypothetical protein FB451DRAFT_1239087 [Mycena latifolia]|nr:hypothetical protein FB451DRAFT_1239087 [Mycena latifolia]
MESALNYTTALAAFISVLALYLVLRQRSTIRNIVGPPSPSWLFGHMVQLILSPRYGDNEFNWQNVYGSVYLLKGCFGQDRLMVSDSLAMQYTLNSPHFYRSPILDVMINLIFGGGSVVSATENEHRRLFLHACRY